MNIFRRKPIRLLTIIFSMLVSIAMLNACGSSGGGSDTTAGIGGTGIAVGKITDFGSVYVNGGVFNTNQSQFIVDGDSNANQDDLSIGMVVLLRVETNNGIFTDKAIDVVYDDEVEGPITNVTLDSIDPTLKTITVFGQTITIDDTNTLFEDNSATPDPNYGFATIAVNDVIEVSGFRVTPTEITATYVEKTDDLNPGFSEVELRGTISQFSAMNQNFMLDSVLITFDNMTDIEVSGVLDNGLFVEVEGIYFDNPSVLVHAEEIEEEEEGFGDDVDDVSLQGVISNYMGDDDFEIDGQLIDASGAPFSPPGATLLDGLEVEVEGDIVGGVLIADELEVREGETELQAQVSPGSVNANGFEVYYPSLPGTVIVNVDAQTLFKDEAGAMPLQDFSINDLNDNDFLKIEGQEVDGEVVASIVKRIDPDGYKLEGAVDIFLFGNWIEILGIRYNVDGVTEYEDNTMTAAMFFGLLQVGDLVEIEDEQVPLGFADDVEFE
jgi:hypothetical protein